MKLIRHIPALLIHLVMAGCGGGGGAGNAAINSSSGNSGTTPTSRNLSFVGDNSTGAAAAFQTLAPSADTIFTGNVLTSTTLLGHALAFDAQRDRLYSLSNQQIAIFDRASTLTGTINPDRLLTPNIAMLEYLHGMFYDNTNDVLYVSYYSDDGLGRGAWLAVFNKLSTLSGTITPDRLLTGLDAGVFTVDVKRSILYTQRSGGYDLNNSIHAYPNLNQQNGVVTGGVSMEIGLVGSGDTFGLAVDPMRDRLYIGLNRSDPKASSPNGIAIVNNASTAGTSTTAQGGAVQPLVAALPMPFYSFPVALAYDPTNDRLYAGFGSTVFILDNAQQLGSASQARALAIPAPAGSQINTFAI